MFSTVTLVYLPTYPAIPHHHDPDCPPSSRPETPYAAAWSSSCLRERERTGKGRGREKIGEREERVYRGTQTEERERREKRSRTTITSHG